MTVNNSENSGANTQPATPAPTENQPAASAPTEEQRVQAAVQSAAPVNAQDMTPDQLLTELRAMPERIVDALKEASGTTSTPPAQTAQQTTETKAGLFSGKSFADWWSGK